MPTHIHCNIIYNSQDVEGSKLSHDMDANIYISYYMLAYYICMYIYLCI